MHIGSILKEARETQGWSLEEVAEKTKIRYKYIQALEDGSFEILPGGRVYAKGFIRNYARFLGLNPEELAAELEKIYVLEDVVNSSQENIYTQEEKKGREKIVSWRRQQLRPVSYALIVLIIGLLVILGIGFMENRDIFYQNTQKQDDNPSAIQVSPNGDVEGNTASEQESQPAFEYKGVDLMLNVTQESSWMRVVVDGKIQYLGELTASQSKNFRAEKSIQIKLGNAGAVQVRLNGQDLGYMGKKGEVIEKEFLTSTAG